MRVWCILERRKFTKWNPINTWEEFVTGNPQDTELTDTESQSKLEIF